MKRIARAPFVAVSRVEQYPHRCIVTDIKIGAASYVGRAIGWKVLVALDDSVTSCHQLRCNRLRIDIASTDSIAAAKIGIKRRLQIAVTIVKSAPILRAAIISIAKLIGGFTINADIAADGQECFAWYGFGGQVDHTAAEFTGEVGRIGFLHKR